jgi:DNA-binding NtrC family response regulator
MHTSTLGGLEGLRVVQETAPLVPAIMLSDDTSEENAVAAMKAGAHDFVSRSHLDRLRAAVDSALREMPQQ